MTVVLHTLTPATMMLGPPAVCDDGVVAPGLEDRDDHNQQNGDGCSSMCRVEAGWACTGTTLSVCSPCSGASCLPSPWYDSSWQHRKQITIDGSRVTGPLTNFPVLVSLADTDLSTVVANENELVFCRRPPLVPCRTDSASTSTNCDATKHNGQIPRHWQLSASGRVSRRRARHLCGAAPCACGARADPNGRRRPFRGR